ncbi:hypothetical protein JOC34_000471 [Virgibacillus halotolerans]|nr:hypothetical protein [Virgibacillus halotolerans]MBM7598114.1 hypothetical protein [Virgibacillus halotolerans]
MLNIFIDEETGLNNIDLILESKFREGVDDLLEEPGTETTYDRFIF